MMARWWSKLFSRCADRTDGSVHRSGGVASSEDTRLCPSDDAHLGDLVKTLRSMEADSPEMQSRLEQIAQNYAQGTYRVDTQATAAKMIDDAFR
jgi:anti-sigma28 factor (negative regulator of flagellin synthesis)